jgi:hypothetical protein
MIKAGFIGAVAGFIYVMSLTLVSPFCTLCFTPLLGIGVGYLASRFDRPPKLESSSIVGGIAGGIAGFAALVGQMLATVVNGVLVTNWEELPFFFKQLGFQVSPTEYWQTTLTANSFCSLLNLAIMVGLGALGGVIWFQHQSRKSLSTVKVTG